MRSYVLCLLRLRIPTLTPFGGGRPSPWPAPKSPAIPPSAGTPRNAPRVRVRTVFRDGLRVAREARGARRGEPRCPDTPLALVPVRNRTSLYEEITDKIIAELEAGRIPWVQPWGTAAAKAPLAMPQNASTRRRYSGINVLILWGAVIERGFSGQSWLTFRQALGLGGQRPKGRTRHDRRLRRSLRAQRRAPARSGDR